MASHDIIDFNYIQTMSDLALKQVLLLSQCAFNFIFKFFCVNFFNNFQSFLDYFAQALRYEYKNHGIVIQSLRPFYVNTKMTRYSKTLTSNGFLVPSAEVYARHAVATLGYSGRTTGYWPHTIQVA